MDEKELQEFSLEDIIKEFGGDTEPEGDVTPEEVAAELAELLEETPLEEPTEEPAEESTEEPTEAAAEEPVLEIAEQPEEISLEAAIEETVEEVMESPAPEAEQPQSATSDTIRLETIPDSTIRLDKMPQVKGQVRDAQHIDDEDEPILPPAPEEKAEPYSEEWEPEYEQPISEYVPPKPIQFQPHSRLRELKKKLVDGPERLYYRLSEKGKGKLQLAIFVNLIVLLLTTAATVMYHFGFIGEHRLRFMVFGQLFCMLFAAIMGSGQLVEGFADLVRKRFSLNTVLLFTFLLCCADGVLGLYEKRIPCCAAFSLQMTMSLWNVYHDRNTKLDQFDTMRKATKLDSLNTVDDYLEGRKGVLRGEGQVEDFMDNYDKPSTLQKVVSIYAVIALCLSIAAGVAAGVLHYLGTGMSAVLQSVSTGVQVAAVTSLAAVPASMHVFLSRPMAILERRLHRAGTVLCGWKGVEGLSGKVAFPVDHRDLFPTGTAKLNGVKFFGDRQPDQIIAYATALVAADDGMLAPLFVNLLDNRNGRHYPAEQLTVYEGGGIGALVNGEPVLAGSISFLKTMGVEPPEGIRVDQAICVAVDGEFCGLFAISYDKDRMATAGMVSLCGYRSIKPVLVGGSFVLTEKFIYDRFGVRPKRIHFADPETREALAQKKAEEDAPALALITGNGLAPYVYAVTGARTLKSAAKTGLVIHMIGGILGVSMMIALAVLGATYLLTPLNLFLYELVWMIPGLLITEWTRSI